MAVRPVRVVVLLQLVPHHIESVLGDCLLVALNVHSQHIPFLIWFLEGGDLAPHHLQFHVVAFAVGETFLEGLLVEFEIDKVDLYGRMLVVGDADDISVLVFEGGAGDDDAVGCLKTFQCFFS